MQEEKGSTKIEEKISMPIQIKQILKQQWTYYKLGASTDAKFNSKRDAAGLWSL